MIYWTGFIMPVFVNASCLLLISLTGLLSLFSADSQATNFSVESARIIKIENDYVLQAYIKYPLTESVKEAIENGISISVLQEFKLVRSVSILQHFWQWQKSVWLTEIRYELSYHALSEQYTLKNLHTSHLRNFPTLQSALSALGTIKKFRLPQQHTLDTSNLTLQIRSGLDLHALPGPMRPIALTSTKWHLTSSWKKATWP